jgi:hypothetical protein
MKKEIIKEFEKWSESQKSYTKHDVFLAGYELAQQENSEQRDEMLQMLEETYAWLYNDQEYSIRNPYLKQLQQLIKKVKNE